MTAGAGAIGARGSQTPNIALSSGLAEVKTELRDFEAFMRGKSQLSSPEVQQFYSLFGRISSDFNLSGDLGFFLAKVTAIFAEKVPLSTLQGLPLSNVTYSCQQNLCEFREFLPLFPQDFLRQACFAKDLNSIRGILRANPHAANIGSGIFPDLTPFQIAQLTCNESAKTTDGFKIDQRTCRASVDNPSKKLRKSKPDEFAEAKRNFQLVNELLKYKANPMVGVTTEEEERVRGNPFHHPLYFICTFFDEDLVHHYFAAGGTLPKTIDVQKVVSNFLYHQLCQMLPQPEEAVSVFLILVEEGIAIDYLALISSLYYLFTEKITPEIFSTIASNYLANNAVKKMNRFHILPIDSTSTLLPNVFIRYPTLRETFLDIGFDPSECITSLLDSEESCYPIITLFIVRYKEGKNQFWNQKGHPLSWSTRNGSVWETLTESVQTQLQRVGHSPI